MSRFENERRWCERVPVTGVAALMELGYLGIVYQLEDLSPGGARLRGPLVPPATGFEILLRVADRYATRRARYIWLQDDGLGIEFEALHEGELLEWTEISELEEPAPANIFEQRQ